MKLFGLEGEYYKQGSLLNLFSNGKYEMVRRYNFGMMTGLLVEWLGKRSIDNSRWPKQTSLCSMISGNC